MTIEVFDDIVNTAETETRATSICLSYRVFSHLIFEEEEGERRSPGKMWKQLNIL